MKAVLRKIVKPIELLQNGVYCMHTGIIPKDTVQRVEACTVSRNKTLKEKPEEVAKPVIKEHTAYVLTKARREDISACGSGHIDLYRDFFKSLHEQQGMIIQVVSGIRVHCDRIRLCPVRRRSSPSICLGGNSG